MFRFGKPDGTSFGLEYLGTIHAFDSGNDTVAICRGSEKIDLDEEDIDPDIDPDFEDIDPDEEDIDPDFDCENLYEVTGDPLCWTDWEVVSGLLSEEQEILLQRAIASTYNACTLCESMVNSSEED